MKRFLLLAALFTASCAPEHQIAVVTSKQSPDGSQTAVAYTDMGGGAAGWCYVCVDVVAGTFNAERARCIQGQQWFRCGTEVVLEWSSPLLVVASFKGEAVIQPIQQRQSAKSAPSISVEYRAQ
jgi:hypothetical protein